MVLDIEDKARLRHQLMEHRRSTPQTEREAINHAIYQQVVQQKCYADCATLFIYYSTVDEIDTHEIIADALRRGKRVCVPKCMPGHRMQPRCIQSEQDLTEQTFGIPEPGEHCAAVAPADIDLCIIPALACDLTGSRLGYGGGFYDRFLLLTPACRMVLCAQARVLPYIPAQPHDVPCDCILTEREVMLIHER